MSAECTVDAILYGENKDALSECINKCRQLWQDDYGWYWEEGFIEDDQEAFKIEIETACKNGVESIAKELIPIMKEYKVWGDFYGETFDYLDEGYVSTDENGKIVEQHYFSFRDAIQEYGEDDFDLFLENMKECVEGTNFFELLYDDSEPDDLREIFDNNYDDEANLMSALYHDWLWGDTPVHWFFKEYL